MARKRREAEPFEWLRSPTAPPDRKRRETMYLNELRERAVLLKRLNYSHKETRARLHANVAWDFELSGTPGFAGKIDGIVDDVYGRSGPGRGTPSS